MNSPRILASIALLWLAIPTPLQTRQPEAAGENLLRLEGTDHGSGIHYQKLILLLNSPDTADSATPGTQPRFTMECREKAGKRSLHWLVRFEGSPDFSFQPPDEATSADPMRKPNPTVTLKMRFEGYMRSEEFKRQWERLPTGELHYRNSGFGSANLDGPRHFMQWLTGLPNLRIGYAKPTPGQSKELVFPTQPMLALMKSSNFCEP